MRVLVLGNSDTRGDFAAGETWPAVVAAALSAGKGRECLLREVPFSAIAPGAPEYAVRKVTEFDADLVILPLGTFAFSVGFAWVRVRRLFGKRVAERFRRAEEAFDTRTRPAGRVPGRFNTFTRRAIRRLLGTQPLTSRAALGESYRTLLQALARAEGIHVLVVAYPPEQGKLVKLPDLGEQRKAFLAEVAAAARRHHFFLLDTAPLFQARPAEPLITPDGFHLQAGGHRLVGEAVARAIEAAEAATQPS